MAKRNNGVTTAKGEVLQACAVPSVKEMLYELEEGIRREETITFFKPLQIGAKLWFKGGSRVTHCPDIKRLAAVIKSSEPIRMTLAVSLPHLGAAVLVLFGDLEQRTLEGSVWIPGSVHGPRLRMLHEGFHPGHYATADYFADKLDLKFVNSL